MNARTDEPMKEALHYEQLEDSDVRCNLCAHRCYIEDQGRGICRVRENRGGILYTLVYGRTISRNVDPIEKKPLYHVLPGSRSYSIATPGCNVRCGWCQNAEISQLPRRAPLPMGQSASPAELAADAAAKRCASIAYTYTEPTIFFEYARDTAECAREHGMLNVFVTNGYMTQAALEDIAPLLDAANVDLKGFSGERYRREVGARLEPVLDSIRRMKALGIWVEVTTLVIPGFNDSEEELKDIAGFIANDAGRETPWHISRFFPLGSMQDRPPTPPETIELARQIGFEAGLHYVYAGNIRLGGDESATRCPSCGETVIWRAGYARPELNLDQDGCAHCGGQVHGLFVRGGESA